MDAVATDRTPDNVVGKHRFDIHVALFRLFREMDCTEQALFFARHGHENDRRVEFILRHHSRHFQNRRRPRRVVVRTRRIALCIGRT